MAPENRPDLAETDRLARARAEADRHHTSGGHSTADSPDERTVPSILAGILDALIAIADTLQAPTAPVPPGPCWNDSGIPTKFGGDQAFTVRCELLAGHAGAHEASRQFGGTSVWPNEEVTRG